jgi:oligopeptide transport system substrate-binding protein
VRAGAGRVRSRLRLSAIGCAALLLLGVACTSDDESSSPDTSEAIFEQGGELRLAAVDVQTFDPGAAVPTNQAEMITIDLLYDSLTVFPTGLEDEREAVTNEGTGADELRATPDLAESLTPNGNASVWTVKLEDRTFSDDTPIRASDVKATYERLAKKGSASLAGVRLDIITGYQELATGASTDMSGLRVVDDRTLEISLREPYIQLPELLASPLYGIVPKASADAGDTAFTEPVGSGPYAYADHDDVRTRLERSTTRSGADVGPDAIDLVGFASWDDAYRAFADGQIDWSLVPASSLDDATNTYGSDHFAFFGSELWLGFNLADPTLADARFRQAIVQAISSDKVVADTLPGRWPLRAIVPRDVPGYNIEACVNLCDYSQDVARAWLALAFPAGGVPTVMLDGYEDPVQRAMLESVKTQLGAVGIPAEVRLRPFEEYRSFATSGQQAVFSFGWVGIAPMQDAYLAPLFRSNSPDNVTGFRSADIDAQISQARTNGNAEQREEAYRWIERQVLNQSVLVPIAQLRTNQVVADRVQGWSTRLDGTFVVPDVWVNG